MTEYASIYMMVEADGAAFKIGRSNNPSYRAWQLSNEIDYAKSRHYVFHAEDVGAAERVLHFLFRRYRLCNRARCDGSTEWFAIGAMARAIEVMDLMRSQFGWLSVEPITELDYEAFREAVRAERRQAEREGRARRRRARATKAHQNRRWRKG